MDDCLCGVDACDYDDLVANGTLPGAEQQGLLPPQPPPQRYRARRQGLGVRRTDRTRRVTATAATAAAAAVAAAATAALQHAIEVPPTGHDDDDDSMAADADAEEQQQQEQQLSDWQIRRKSQRDGWRQHAPHAAAARLRRDAAPQPEQCCEGCNTRLEDAEGSAVRCWSCWAGSRVLCEQCDAAAHTRHGAHMHERERYVDGLWQPLPRIEGAHGCCLDLPPCAARQHNASAWRPGLQVASASRPAAATSAASATLGACP